MYLEHCIILFCHRGKLFTAHKPSWVRRIALSFCFDLLLGKNMSQFLKCLFYNCFQKRIIKFFVEGKSDLHIETLKDTEIVEEDEEELGSQESQTSSFILDPLSQTIEHSDNESVPDGQDFLA
jgi:hypothetical protein